MKENIKLILYVIIINILYISDGIIFGSGLCVYIYSIFNFFNLHLIKEIYYVIFWFGSVIELMVKAIKFFEEGEKKNDCNN